MCLQQDVILEIEKKVVAGKKITEQDRFNLAKASANDAQNIYRNIAEIKKDILEMKNRYMGKNRKYIVVYFILMTALGGQVLIDYLLKILDKI